MGKHPFTPEQQVALWESAWHHLVDCVHAKSIHSVYIGAVTCPCCKKWNLSFSESPNTSIKCLGCPIYSYTNLSFCVGTPYSLQHRACSHYYSGFQGGEECFSQFVKASEKEYRFLVCLALGEDPKTEEPLSL